MENVQGHQTLVECSNGSHRNLNWRGHNIYLSHPFLPPFVCYSTSSISLPPSLPYCRAGVRSHLRVLADFPHWAHPLFLLWPVTMSNNTAHMHWYPCVKMYTVLPNTHKPASNSSKTAAWTLRLRKDTTKTISITCTHTHTISLFTLWPQLMRDPSSSDSAPSTTHSEN